MGWSGYVCAGVLLRERGDAGCEKAGGDAEEDSAERGQTHRGDLLG